MNAEIDPYPVSELQSRYSIGKQAVYNRLEALSIKPYKQGNRSFITLDQLLWLDQRHSHITAGGTMTDFISPQTESAISQVASLDTSTVPSQIESLVSLVEALALALKPVDPLAHLAHLERAANSGWLLTSSQVQQLLGVKPKVDKGEHSFSRGSFTFIKEGKIGGQTAWRVVKST
jgi:hypothetical protein